VHRATGDRHRLVERGHLERDVDQVRADAGAVAALADLGLRAPDDLAVIGFDDTAHGALWRPPLTTVRVDARAYDRRTARVVLGLPAGDARPVPARVIERATT
jgi:DNA-binding LacI/PurR family transcriptional regulator